MSEIETPICDLIERLLSQGLSRDMSLEAARAVEATLVRSTISGGSAAENREKERLRKARWRAKNPGHVPGQKAADYILKEDTNSQNLMKKESKKESGVPNCPGTRTGPEDDWPENALDLFWAQYPPGRKGEKKAVAAKLAKIRKSREVTFATLMLGVSRYAGSNPDPKYTKAPLVWLNRGCWDDEHVRGGGSNAKTTTAVGGYSGLAAKLRQRLAEEDQLQFAQPADDPQYDHRR
jgi:hypothetical protein